jgi:hypothetical protein
MVSSRAVDPKDDVSYLEGFFSFIRRSSYITLSYTVVGCMHPHADVIKEISVILTDKK